MGWTYIDRAPADVRAFLDAEYESALPGMAPNVLESVLDGEGTYYAAVAYNDRDTGAPAVGCLVTLTDRKAGGLGWKTMDESMGPYARRCPPSILERLTPLTPNAGPYAAKWRAACWRNAGRPDMADRIELEAAGQGSLL